MSLLSWNCRGSGGSLRSRKMQHLARLMSSTHSQVTFISETRNSHITANDLTDHFHVSDSFVVLAIGLSGGLWLMWNDDVDVDIISSSHYYVLACVVQKSRVHSFNLVCVCMVIPTIGRQIPFGMMSLLLLYKIKEDLLYVWGI